MSDLVFVPSLLKPTFERDSVETVGDLLALNIENLRARTGWGDRKVRLFSTLQKLYGDCANRGAFIDGDSDVSSVIASELLPDVRCGEMTVSDFVKSSADTLKLKGRKKADFDGLKRFFHAYAGYTASVEGTWHFSFLDGFEHVEMDWRDVPMNVSKRVADFLDRFQVVTLHQLDRLAVTAHFTCPNTGELLPALKQENFGKTSLANLQNEIEKLGRLGLDGYRHGVICSLEHLPDPNTEWREIPLKLPKRVVEFLDAFEVRTLRQVYKLAVRAQVLCPESGELLPALDQKDFSEKSLDELRKELNALAERGLEHYQYGDVGKPVSAKQLSERAMQFLVESDAEILRLRCDGLSLGNVAAQLQRTRQRVNQLEKRAIESLSRLRPAAREILRPLDNVLCDSLLIELRDALALIGADHYWQLEMAARIAGKLYVAPEPGVISQFSKRQIEAIEALLRDTMNTETFTLENGRVSLHTLVVSATHQHKWFVKECGQFAARSDLFLTKEQVKTRIGVDWLRAYVRGQLVEAGVNGLFFDQIETFELVGSPDELTHILGLEAEVLADGRFRRPGELYAKYGKSDEIVKIVRDADHPISALEIMAISERKWYQPQLVSYLTVLHEIVMTDRGRYIHIDKLSLSIRDVVRIADWGAELLAGEKKTIDGEILFDLYNDADLGLPLENTHQLVSIIAKHPDVRRISNNLQLAHRDSFDEAELFLAATDSDIAAQWHPEKNGDQTPEAVRPTSTKIYWWRCEQGHEFQASPFYRTRLSRNCPGCQERWTITKIRHFVRALLKHLYTFTPAELYVIFQQSGLWQRGGKAKGFVKALATGRFPKKELEKFIEGEKSLVDEFLDDSELALDQTAVLDDEQLDEPKDASLDDLGKADADESMFPQVRTKKVLEALDSQIIASTDAEATEFLLASAKAKIWSHAYRDENEATEEVKKFGESAYAEQVRVEFLEEYQAASKLSIPDGYSFSIEGKVRQPNLMQKHVAAQIRDYHRHGNWSGTGAGKTLSAILATRVVNASLTVVCCPNAVVGDAGDGWAREIRRVFPDSEVITKTLNPDWSGWGKHRYLVLNYEQFQQPNSEALLKRFLEANDIDFVVIDEIHHTKQRHADDMSQRKRLVQALVSATYESNPQLCVLGMSATPVINNLQEGKSLVEMISGIEHADLDIKPTVPNCMRLHQKLVSLGTRWRPTYDSALETETVDVDCSEYLDAIRALGKNHSPLELEQILTRARLPIILDYLSNDHRTLIYTHYVQGIDRMLYEAISSAGYRVGFYTGKSKEGLDAFKAEKLDVLIGSAAVGTGVDGIQHCCSQLIINVLSWTNAEYEQLVGRLWRQGQTEEKVKVIIPVTFANVNGKRWSYCDSKLHRITYKKSIADAAVDGAVPEGNLRSPAQAQRDVMAWLERLEQGQLTTVTRKKIIVPLSGDEREIRRRLAKYGDFSQLNNRWNRSNSKTLSSRLKANPQEWEHYHTLYRQARTQWSVVPVHELVAWCKKREGYEIGDFGCGEALLAKAVSDCHTVHSFDHIALDDSVIEGDMSHTTLDDESLDVAVFSLSLMGDNFTDYLKEAHRVLKIDGHIHIWEATRRFNDVQLFCASLEKLGFRTFPPEERGHFTHIQGQKTDRRLQKNVKLTF